MTTFPTSLRMRYSDSWGSIRYSSSLIGSASSSSYIGLPVWLGNVVERSMPSAVESRQQVLRGVGDADRAFAARIGSANDLAHPQAAGGNQAEAGLRPVSAAVRWGAAASPAD